MGEQLAFLEYRPGMSSASRQDELAFGLDLDGEFRLALARSLEVLGAKRRSSSMISALTRSATTCSR